MIASPNSSASNLVDLPDLSWIVILFQAPTVKRKKMLLKTAIPLTKTRI